MRHKKSFNHLGRQSAHRKSMLSNMASSLIMHKRIETTTAKAKALKRFIEPLITRSKDDSTHSRRVVFSHLQDKDAVSELFREVGVKVADRPGGYTRIIKLGNRQGDNADMCLIELVDYNENLLAEKAATRKSAGRRRRGGAKPKAEVQKTAGTKTGTVKPVAGAVEEIAEVETAVVEAVAEETVVEEAVAEETVVEEAVAEETMVEETVAEVPVAEEPEAVGDGSDDDAIPEADMEEEEPENKD
jgi:large subunit ribosomal protein L17